MEKILVKWKNEEELSLYPIKVLELLKADKDIEYIMLADTRKIIYFR